MGTINFFFGPLFEIQGPNKRVDLVFKKSGRPDSRAEKFPSIKMFTIYMLSRLWTFQKNDKVNPDPAAAVQKNKFAIDWYRLQLTIRIAVPLWCAIGARTGSKPRSLSFLRGC